MKQVFRNKAMIPLITVIPIVQLVLLSFAATNEIKNIRLGVMDQDQSNSSMLLHDKFLASESFVSAGTILSQDAADDMLQLEKADIVLVIPEGFERSLYRGEKTDVQLQVNAINGSKGGVAGAYSAMVIQKFNREVLPKLVGSGAVIQAANPVPFNIQTANWYNPTLDYKVYMVPGILAALSTIITLILSAMNLVREKEIGTIEQINVTPIKKYQFIIGKLLPFLLIGLGNLTFALIAAKIFFNIPMVGSLALIYAFCTLAIVAMLGMGLLISSVSETQQQAMFVAWFFMMIFILMGGLFTPIESMPIWAQKLTIPNPVSHFASVMRSVLLKGSGWAEMSYHFTVISITAVIVNLAAVVFYRKRTS